MLFLQCRVKLINSVERGNLPAIVEQYKVLSKNGAFQIITKEMVYIQPKYKSMLIIEDCYIHNVT